ncbi:cytochrome P450 [Hordeum vulgare]|nr:cytochrome P450 [Hordeum vulgare]
MLPSLIANWNNIHEYAAAGLSASGHNLELRCPSATSVRYFVTCCTSNVRHIFTSNFANYVKGEKLAKVLGILGGTIVTADGESWRRQRDTIHHVMTRPRLQASIYGCCRSKLAGGLVPLLNHLADAQASFDMEDLLGRLVFDITVIAVFRRDPCRLTASMPPMHVAAAMDTVMEVAVCRDILPVSFWKTMRWLNIGQERKLAEAEAVLYGFVAESIQRKMEVTTTTGRSTEDDILSHYIHVPSPDPEFLNHDREPTDFLIRTFINFMVAMRDPMGSALSWLVYNLATHPQAMLAIREELAPIAAARKSVGGVVVFEPNETKDLVYQRAAMFESLRLYPIAPLERKEVVADDVLPSGHKVRAGDTILISTYSMGRLEQVWGEDCRKYWPERWLSSKVDGSGYTLRHVPSHEFIAFNTGPRACLGKNISVALVTSIIATVAWNFDVEVLDNSAVRPKLSVVLQMKNGLMAKVKRRSGRERQLI